MTVTVLKQLIDKIREDMPSIESNEETEQINKHFQTTLVHIRHRQETGDPDGRDYGGLVL